MENSKIIGKEHDVILYPLISEKSMSGISELKYTFKVRKDACKVDIRKAIEKIFDVKVAKVNTLMVRGRKRRRGRIVGFTPSWKKAIVSLAPGQKGIEFFNQIT
jgi:large subunit ribosomal protein L23